jgi:hypothetical protein
MGSGEGRRGGWEAVVQVFAWGGDGGDGCLDGCLFVFVCLILTCGNRPVDADVDVEAEVVDATFFPLPGSAGAGGSCLEVSANPSR